MPKQKKWPTVKANFVVGKSKKVWETVDIPKPFMDSMEALAKIDGVSLDTVFCAALDRMMQRDNRRRLTA